MSCVPRLLCPQICSSGWHTPDPSPVPVMGSNGGFREAPESDQRRGSGWGQSQQKRSGPDGDHEGRCVLRREGPIMGRVGVKGGWSTLPAAVDIWTPVTGSHGSVFCLAVSPSKTGVVAWQVTPRPCLAKMFCSAPWVSGFSEDLGLLFVQGHALPSWGLGVRSGCGPSTPPTSP